jgi:hypothetical protein
VAWRTVGRVSAESDAGVETGAGVLAVDQAELGISGGTVTGFAAICEPELAHERILQAFALATHPVDAVAFLGVRGWDTGAIDTTLTLAAALEVVILTDAGLRVADLAAGAAGDALALRTDFARPKIAVGRNAALGDRVDAGAGLVGVLADDEACRAAGEVNDPDQGGAGTGIETLAVTALLIAGELGRAAGLFLEGGIA